MWEVIGQDKERCPTLRSKGCLPPLFSNMSSLRLGLKRSLSGQDDSNDVGGMEVAAITQQPAAKKKKAASLK